jgi:predicted RND superfamily exporter protein
VRADNSFRLWFPESSRVREDDLLLNSRSVGTATLRILVGGLADGALYDPDVLRAVSDLEEFLRKVEGVSGVTSIADHVKRMNRAMHDDDPAYYSIPDDKRLVAQYLLLYSISAGPDGLSAFVDAPYRNAVVRALSETDAAAFSRDLIDRTEKYVESRFPGLPAVVHVAGGTLGVQTAMNDVVVNEKVANIIQVTGMIFILCSLVLRSLTGAVFVLMPLAVSVLITLGIMGWSGIWLDMSTAGITAMGVSIGADFAIYLIFRIREERARGRTLEEAIREGMRTSGKAIFFVSSAVAVGYLVLPLSGFSIWIRLGVLTASMVSISALGALTIIPALAVLTAPRFLEAPSKLIRSS